MILKLSLTYSMKPELYTLSKTFTLWVQIFKLSLNKIYRNINTNKTNLYFD